jgi:hypothetical protein
MHREIRPVAQMSPATNHGEVDAGLATLNLDRQNVHIAVLHVVHGLLVQHVGQGCHLVAQFGRLFKLQLVGVRHHARLQLLHHALRIAAQKPLGIGNIYRHSRAQKYGRHRVRSIA